MEQGGIGGNIFTVPPFPHEAFLSEYRWNKGKFVVKGMAFLFVKKVAPQPLTTSKQNRMGQRGYRHIFAYIPLVVLLNDKSKDTEFRVQNLRNPLNMGFLATRFGGFKVVPYNNNIIFNKY